MRMLLRYWYHWLAAVLFVCVLLIAGAGAPARVQSETLYDVYLPKLHPIPVFQQLGVVDSGTSLASISARAVLVVDMPTNAILFEKNADELIYPASTTKLMTALVAFRSYTLSQVITVPLNAREDGFGMGLVAGEQITVHDLLRGLLINSANDAAVTLASAHPQGEMGFVADMNSLASLFHLKQTHFSNPAGLDDEQQLSTARDLALLAEAALREPVLAEIMATRGMLVTNTSGVLRHQLTNTNKLLGNPGVFGVKTGTTPLAGEVLLASWETPDTQLLTLVLGSTDRYADSLLLRAWIDKHYAWFPVEFPLSEKALLE